MSRDPLDAAALRDRLPGRWTRLDVVEHTTSTNADLLADTVDPVTGGPPYRVLVAEHQSAGRGRLDRGWESPPGAGLLFSARVRPDVAVARWGWLPLLVGVALAEAVTGTTGLATSLKWPNDLLTGDASGKLAGILAQTGGSATNDVVVGIGLNVDTRRAEFTYDIATSLRLEGCGEVDRAALLTAVLTHWDRRLTAWTAADGDAAGCGLAHAYRSRCATLGREVRVLVAGGDPIDGTARDVDDTGRLVLDTAQGERRIGAGDVTHVRPTDTRGATS